ncbi:MAG: response regulator [Gemmatimonadales bacterium]|nr:response regulator [Gemmatimonadales bacterium]
MPSRPIPSRPRAATDLPAVPADGPEEWRRFVDALPGVLLEYLLPLDGPPRMLKVSGQLEERLGLAPAAVLANPLRLWARIHPSDRQRLLDQRVEAIEEERGFEEELRVLHRDGSWRHARVSTGAPTRTAEGLLLRTIAMDITAARDLEHALWEAQRREAMGRLASGVAHNFNNMLAAILPNLELLQAAVPDPLVPLAMEARQAAMAASELVRQVATLARREDQPLDDVFDVVDVVREVVRICHNTFDRAITLTCDAPSSPVWVLGRRSEILQVVLNLALNARDALEGRPAPRIALEVEDDETRVLIRVIDNGEGMSAEVQRQLGTPFFSTRPADRGTGLGIATNLGMLRAAHGSLRWRSTEGLGSTFEVELPARRLPPDLRIVPSDPDAAAATTILIIDDEPLVRSSVRRLLERLGHVVEDADLGITGLDRLARNPDIGLVMVDLSMPQMSGQEVIRRIRTTQPDLPIIIMSGYVPEGLKPGPHTRILFKPFLLDELRGTIASLLR